MGMLKLSMYILFAALGKLTNSYTARVTTCVLGRDVVLSCRLDYSGTNVSHCLLCIY